MLTFSGTKACIIGTLQCSIEFTLCYDVPTLTGLVVLFMVFLVLSNRYTLCERNREINIQAIVKDHYERYSGPSIIRTPLVTADSSGVRIIEIVGINETT